MLAGSVPELCCVLAGSVPGFGCVLAGSVPELFMNNSHVDNNLQHGMLLENVRNYAFINASELSHNMYGAGLKVFGGAGKLSLAQQTLARSRR